MPTLTAPDGLFFPNTQRGQAIAITSHGLGSGLVGAAGGAASGSVVPGIGTAIGALAGFLGGLFGGSSAPDPPTLHDQLVQTLRQYFPDQNAPVCGVPIDIGFLNGGAPGLMTIPCDDPNFGNASRSTLEWYLGVVGLATFIKNLWGFISTPGAQSQSAGTAATVNVTAAVNVTADALSGLTDAITTGFTDANNGLSSVLGNAISGISGTIGSVVGNLTDGVSNAIKNIGDVVKGAFGDIGNVLKSIGTTIWDAIKGIADKIGDIFANDIVPILKAIADDIGKVVDFYKQHIEPILQAVNNSIKAIEGAVAAIHADIQSGLQGILKLPGDLANAFSSLDAAMQRAVEALETRQAATSEKLYGYDGKKTLSGDFGNLTSAVKGVGSFSKILESFGDFTKINYPQSQAIGEELSSLLPQLMAEELNILMGVMKGVFDDVKKQIFSAEIGLAAILDVGPVLALAAGAALHLIEPLHHYFEELVNEKLPLAKLDPNVMSEALRRHVVSEDEFREELLVQGIDSSRATIYARISRTLLDPGTVLAAWYRNVFDDASVGAALGELGYTADDITALKEASVKAFSPGLAVTAYQRQLITEQQLRDSLAISQLSQAEIDVTVATAFGPDAPQIALQAEHKRDFIGMFTTRGDTIHVPAHGSPGDPDYQPAKDVNSVDLVPTWFADKCKAQGLDEEATNHQWWLSFNTLDIGSWVNLYFRGIRTSDELTAKLDEQHIPRHLQKDLIDSMRPVIPFRTIPSMVKAGILTQAEGFSLLEAHGYDQYSAGKLMAYALQKTTAATATTAQQLHTESVAVARQLWDDGAINDQDYESVLLAHNYTQAAADATIKVQKAQRDLKARQETAAGIVAQFQAGQITKDQATQQLTVLGFSAGEQAKYSRQLRAAKTAVNKLPPEGDLNHMMQKSIITQDDYVAALEAQGYSETWAQRFLSYRVGQTAPTPS